MKTIELADATKSLSEYAEQAVTETVMVTRRGKPVAVLSSANGMDAESIALANNPRFVEIIRESRQRQAAEGGLSLEEVRRLLELPKPRLRKRRRITRGSK